MSLKEKYSWIKHLDFSLIDLSCLIIAFLTAYYLRFDILDVFEYQEWSVLFIIICSINIIVTFCLSPYSGILKRRYYIQFRKEILLFIYQISVTFTLFYALKIGTIFSRKMMFTMYFLYFSFSQTIKYFYKKYLTKKYKKILYPDLEEKNEDVENKNQILISNKHRKVKNIIYAIMKRIIDIIGGIVGCVLLIPLTIIVFIMNKLNEEDDGPIFYVQERIGKNGEPFRMFKYRSMVSNADEKLESFLEENEDIRKEFMIFRKITNDPRITKVGMFLRKTSLDEFPQFINVLLGDMSLVGPRPYLIREKKIMGKYYNTIIRYKPGITGLWQVNGRSNVSFDERLDLDIVYHKEHSVFMDLKILMMTIKKVIKGEGAN